jgi:thiosulfate/3-mercaptopyruvate sulfurtransferase
MPGAAFERDGLTSWDTMTYVSLPLVISPRELSAVRATFRNIVVLDARPDPADFDAAHLDGAIYADLNRHLSRASEPDFDPRFGGRHPLPSVGRWSRLLGQWGIDPMTPVVIYDEQDCSNAAARAWWMLRSVGHKNVGVIDGGFRAAIAAGLSTSAVTSEPVPKDAYPVDAWQLPTVDIQAVEALRTDPAWKVLDVRSAPRFRGETEPIDPIAGHIPGAVNLPFTQNLDGGRLTAAPVLREQYESLLKGTAPERLIVHCGSGVTACQTLLALDVAGFSGASLYVGSWSEWCRNDMPRASGTDDPGM